MKSKTRSARSRLSRLLALALAMLMTLTLAPAALAADDTRSQTDPPPYTIDRYGNVTLTISDTVIKTDWDNDGCQLDTCFLTNNSMLRRLRLTFNSAYDLYDAYQNALAANTIDSVLQKSFSKYGKLADYLSTRTIKYHRGEDGVTFLYGLKNSAEYRRSSAVRYLVQQNLSDLEGSYAQSLRRTLELFYSEKYLSRLLLHDLQALAAVEVATPEYITFHNTLFGHDCYVIEELMRRGYSLDYVSQLCSDNAKAAVATIWPNYVDLMNAYWYQYRAW